MKPRNSVDRATGELEATLQALGQCLASTSHAHRFAELRERARNLVDDLSDTLDQLPDGETSASYRAKGARLMARLALVIAVPLNAEAVMIIRKQLGKHSTHVFRFRGQPIRQVSTKAWYQALERAGIAEFRWHDLRHTWASWHVQNGTPLFALQEVGGWESPQMVRRYAHLSAEHLAPYADRLGRLQGVADAIHGTNPSQCQK